MGGYMCVYVKWEDNCLKCYLLSAAFIAYWISLLSYIKFSHGLLKFCFIDQPSCFFFSTKVFVLLYLVII